MKKRQVAALTMAAAMSLGALTACGSDSGSAAQTNAEGNEVVTLKWIQVGNGMPDNYEDWLAQINPYLEEKIGVNLDMEIVPWGDWDNRRSVITNSGEAFDILFTDQNRYTSEVSTGAFLDITDMLKEKTPDLYNLIPENYWKAMAIDGKIYGVPAYKDSSITEYFIWDKDMADKYNIDINKVTDFSSLYDALKTIKDGEGGSPYYMAKEGADMMATLWYDQLGMSLPAIGVRYDDESRTVVNPLEQEEILENMDIIHKMYTEGIINGDAPTADSQNKYRTFFTAQGWSGAAQSNWGPNNGIDNCVAVQFDKTVVSNTSVQGSISAISANCKNPEKALELLQLVNTDTKVRDWLYFGVEGQDFEYTEDNKVHRITTDWPMAGYTQGTYFNVSLLDTDKGNQWDEVKALNEAATPSVMLGFTMDTKNIETELANCRAVYDKYKSEFWTGAQDPRELVEKIKGELETAGWETIRAEAQKQIDEWAASAK